MMDARGLGQHSSLHFFRRMKALHRVRQEGNFQQCPCCDYFDAGWVPAWRKRCNDFPSDELAFCVLMAGIQFRIQKLCLDRIYVFGNLLFQGKRNNSLNQGVAVLELIGIEPTTFWMPFKRSSQVSYSPLLRKSLQRIPAVCQMEVRVIRVIP